MNIKSMGIEEIEVEEVIDGDWRGGGREGGGDWWWLKMWRQRRRRWLKWWRRRRTHRKERKDGRKLNEEGNHVKTDNIISVGSGTLREHTEKRKVHCCAFNYLHHISTQDWRRWRASAVSLASPFTSCWASPPLSCRSSSRATTWAASSLTSPRCVCPGSGSRKWRKLSHKPYQCAG